MSRGTLGLLRSVALALIGTACGTAGPDAPAAPQDRAAVPSAARIATDFAATRIGDDVRIEAASAEGAFVWTRRFRAPLSDAGASKPKAEPPAALLSPSGDSGAFVALGGDLMRLGPAGETLWSHSDLFAGQPRTLPGGGVLTGIALDGYRRLARYGPAGQLRWTAGPHGKVTDDDSPSPDADGEWVAVGGRIVHVFDHKEPTIRHLDATTGATLVDYRGEADGRALDGEGTATLTMDTWSGCRDLYRGSTRLPLSAPSGDSAAVEPTVAGLVVFVDGSAVASSRNGILVGFGPDGRRRWSLGLEAPIDLLVGFQQGVLVVTDDRQMVALAQDGKLRWQRPLPPILTAQGGYGVATTPAGTLILGSDDGGLCAVAPDGRIPWCRETSINFTKGIAVEKGKLAVRGANTPLLLTGPPPPVDQVVEPQTILAFQRQPLGEIRSVAALANDEAWALEVRDVHYGATEQIIAWQYRGGRWTPRGGANGPMREESYTPEMKRYGAKQVGEFLALQLVRGPREEVWSFGMRHGGIGDRLSSAIPRLSRFAGAHWQLERSLPESLTDDMVSLGLSLARGNGPLLLCVNRGFDGGLRCARRTGERWDESATPGKIISLDGWGGPLGGDLRWIDGHAWLGTADGQLLRLGKNGWEPVAVPQLKGSIRALWGTAASDIWIIVKPEKYDRSTELHRYDGRVWTQHATPLGDLRDIWGSAPDDVWLVGHEGAAHYDGKRWMPVRGPGRELRAVTGTGRHDVWIGGRTGLWHGTSRPSPTSGRTASVPPSDLAAPVRTWPERWELDGLDTRYRAEPVELAVQGGEALDRALGVACAPGGTTWFHDRRRVLEYDGSKARLLHELAPAPAVEELLCHQCLAPAAAGRGWFVSPFGIYRVDGGAVTRAPHDLPLHLAIGARDSVVWVAGQGDDAAALTRRDGVWTYRTDLPRATYAAVSVAGPKDVWMAGGLASTHDELRTWPAAEGIVAHHDGAKVHHYRAPGGALLAVAAVGPQEAWAVGAAGSIVHVADGQARHRYIPSRVWLRSVWVAGPKDVWIAGDDATLLHWDGRELRRVAIDAEHGRLPFAGVSGTSPDDLWAVGPRRIFRIRRASSP